MKPCNFENDFQKVIWTAIEQEGGEFSPIDDLHHIFLDWLGREFLVYFLDDEVHVNYNIYGDQHSSSGFRLIIDHRDLLDPNWSSKTLVKQAEAVIKRVGTRYGGEIKRMVTIAERSKHYER